MNGIILFTNVMAILIAIYSCIRGIGYLYGDWEYHNTAKGKLALSIAQLRGLSLSWPWPKYFAIMIICIVWVICV